MNEPKSDSKSREKAVLNDALFALDAALVARIKKWDAQKKAPETHLHGCDPKWFDGFCEGQIRELQNVREMLIDLKSGKSIEWANPDANK